MGIGILSTNFVPVGEVTENETLQEDWWAIPVGAASNPRDGIAGSILLGVGILQLEWSVMVGVTGNSSFRFTTRPSA
jgi:hypothetical protein